MKDNDNILDYIKKYKDITFKEVPFNDVDALILAELAYFPFDQYQNKKYIDNETLKYYLDNNLIKVDSRRRQWDLKLLNYVSHSNRFYNIEASDFIKDNSLENQKQFQAVTFHFGDLLYVAFAGTDSSIVGWKEDMNLTYQENIPSDINALTYLENILKAYPNKKVYLGGHSKGGRIAIYSLKNLKDESPIINAYNFDGPGFVDAFYDEKYQQIAHKIKKIIPTESIIGRLINPQKEVIVIKSNKRSIYQHDTYNWIVDGDKFRIDESRGGNKIANILNMCYYSFTNEEKQIITDTAFDILISLNITKIGTKDYNIILAKEAFKHLGGVYRSLPIQRKQALKDFISFFIKEVIKEYRPHKRN